MIRNSKALSRNFPSLSDAGRGSAQCVRRDWQFQWLRHKQPFHYWNETPGSLTNKLWKCLAIPPACEFYEGVITAPPLSTFKLSQRTWWGGKRNYAIHKCSPGLCNLHTKRSTKKEPKQTENDYPKSCFPETLSLFQKCYILKYKEQKL